MNSSFRQTFPCPRYWLSRGWEGRAHLKAGCWRREYEVLSVGDDGKEPLKSEEHERGTKIEKRKNKESFLRVPFLPWHPSRP